MNTQKKTPEGVRPSQVSQDRNQRLHNKSNTFLESSQITKETRLESYITRPTKRATQILSVLDENREMTARELAYELGFTERNAVAPRLTELKAIGLVEVIGKREDRVTGKRVAVWRRRNV